MFGLWVVVPGLGFCLPPVAAAVPAEDCPKAGWVGTPACAKAAGGSVREAKTVHLQKFFKELFPISCFDANAGGAV